MTFTRCESGILQIRTSSIKYLSSTPEDRCRYMGGTKNGRKEKHSSRDEFIKITTGKYTVKSRGTKNVIHFSPEKLSFRLQV